MVEVLGDWEPAFEPLVAAFAEVVNAQSGSGAALCVNHDGRRVVDIWGGWADAERSRPWSRDSIVMPYSVTKPLAAICLLQLVDAGRVRLDAPVQEYWPEMRAPATVRHLLSHQAGLVAITTPLPVDAWYDWDRICGLLAAEEPEWEPGRAHGESALFFGHLVGEIVRRVDGRTLGTYLRDEIGVDFFIGVPETAMGRAVDLTNLEALAAPAHRGMTNPPGSRDPEVVNGVRWRAAEIPAVNGHGSARGLVDFYQKLLAGDLLSSGLLDEATRVQTEGSDRVMGWDNAWGLGFGIDPDGFGMGGLGGSWAGVSRRGGFIMAFVTGTMGNHERVDHLDNVTRACLGQPPYSPT